MSKNIINPLPEEVPGKPTSETDTSSPTYCLKGADLLSQKIKDFQERNSQMRTEETSGPESDGTPQSKSFYMLALKGIGKFILYALIFCGMIVAHVFILVLFVYLAEIPFFARLFSWYNSITQGSFDFLPYALCFFRCYLTNSFLQSVALRFSGRISLFVFSLVLIALHVYALFLPGSFSSAVLTVMELVFASILVLRCFKNKLDPDK